MSHSYAEIFPIEIEGWCRGIENFPGELSPLTIKRIVFQLQPAFLMAFESGLQVDLVAIARQFSVAARGVVALREVLEWLVEALPGPNGLSVDSLYSIADALGQANSSLPGLLDRYNDLHRGEQKRAA